MTLQSCVLIIFNVPKSPSCDIMVSFSSLNNIPFWHKAKENFLSAVVVVQFYTIIITIEPYITHKRRPTHHIISFEVESFAATQICTQVRVPTAVTIIMTIGVSNMALDSVTKAHIT